MAKILIGCRLPHGLTIHHPDPEKRSKAIKIEGLHGSKIIGATYVTTEVDADLWQAWKTVYSDYAPLKNGSIFEAASAGQAEAKAKELKSERTGFEPLKKDAVKGVTADKG